MRIVRPKKAVVAGSRELDSLSASFIRIRVLHYAATETVDAAAILIRLRERGCAVTAKTLDHTLATMTRSGWLKKITGAAGDSRGGHLRSLTPTGHHVLALAKRQLRQLAATLG